MYVCVGGGGGGDPKPDRQRKAAKANSNEFRKHYTFTNLIKLA